LRLIVFCLLHSIHGCSDIPNSLQVEQHVVEDVSSHVSEVYPALKTHGLRGGMWSGLMPFSEDGSPIVGPVAVSGCGGDYVPGLWIAGALTTFP
jgi:glycine/D-amino acid oxidase-like deaminating enzyme